MATTATAIIYGAFDLIGVIQAGGTLDGNDITDAFRRLQNFVGTLGLQTQTIPFIGREVFPLIAGRGGPNDAGLAGGGPYTMGPGGDFNTTRPNRLEGCGILLNATTGTPLPVEVPRAVYSDDAYEAIQIKDLPNQLFTGVYYNPEFTGGLGLVNLWPVPNTNLNSIVFYKKEQLGPFSTLTASYDLPPGYDEMFEYNLAMRLAGPYNRPLPPYVQEMALQTMGIVKRSNQRPVDMAIDPALTNSRRTWYNINTGNA